MAFTRYETKNIGPDKLAMIETLNGICDEYASNGLVLTLRQLYYQCVARGLIENKQSEYKRIGDIARDARMNGLMDWDHLIDRTRNIQDYRTWKGPEDMLQDAAKRFNKDVWKPQRQRVEVWIEKDAAIGVVERVCRENHVPYFSCRGFTSMSEMHEAAQRIRFHIEDGCAVTILHIGDHDPSGLDMSRDIEDRMRKFISVDWAGLHMGLGNWTRGQIRRSMNRHIVDLAEKSLVDPDLQYRLSVASPWQIKRIALTADQITQYSPPPNVAKETDSRYVRYVEETGMTQSWELDALDPQVMVDLIQREIDAIKDDDLWMEADAEMEFERETLRSVGSRWGEVQSLVTA